MYVTDDLLFMRVACVMHGFATGDQSWNVITATKAQTSRQIN